MPTSDPLRPTATPAPEHHSYVLSWVHELLEEGRAFIEAQPGYDRIEPTIEAIMGLNEPERPKNLSMVRSNEIGKIATILSASLSDIKPFWEYRTKNAYYDESVRILAGLSEHWYLERSIDRKLGAAAKYSLAAGSGYTNMVWNPDLQDVDVIAEDPRDVYPVRPLSSPSSLNDAYAVITEKEVPVSYLEARFPHAKGFLKAQRVASTADIVTPKSRLGKFISRLNVSPMEIYKSLMGGPSKQIGAGVPVTYLRTIVARDTTIVDADTYVGQFDSHNEPLNNWSYIAKKGMSRYPRRRMVLCTPDFVLYDGPNIYWHGLSGVSQLTLDPWPWTYLGKSPLWDLLPLQADVDKLLRYVSDRIALIMRPPVVADRRAVSEGEFRKFDIGRPNQKLRVGPGGEIKPMEIPSIDPAVKDHINFLLQRMQYLAGAHDLSAVAQLNQVPGSGTLERLIEAMTPDLRARSRQVEIFMREFATMLAYNFAQFYTMSRRITIMGPSGQTVDDWDFDHNTWIPSHLASDRNASGAIPPDRLLSPRNRYDRTREFMRHLTFHVKPGTLLNDAQMTERMTYLQLGRMGWLDIYTVLQKFDIPNIGEPPSGNILDRLAKQQAMGIGMNVNPAGAKASGQEPPKMRNDGVISESG